MNKQADVSDRKKTAACAHERRERPELSISDLRLILDRLGFDCRVLGDHFIYTRNDIEEIINIQPVGTFIAEIPELSGCMADGKTMTEALHNVQIVAQEWIETARELGREIPVPKGCLQYA